jgi:hypothetical protein
MKTIIYAVEVPKGIIIQGENFIIIGTGETQHGKRVFS